MPPHEKSGGTAMNITQPGAHLDHLMRQTRWHHMQLSAMADMKANMMLTVSSVVVTLSIRYLTDPILKWTAITLILFCVLTILLAAYAAMPKVPIGRHADIKSPTFNILFFGDFAHLNYAEYESAMETIMNNPSQTYEAQVREVYTLGVYLAKKKYRFVRLAYLSFITGFLSGGVVFAATEMLAIGH
jgi:hypothetical protein